ncbi:MAG: TetR/AcrR family transcriptional regulator [Streptococcus sp.]|nr:TetR/AcrR family transcriptional regulator [Streptococcus sp.]
MTNRNTSTKQYIKESITQLLKERDLDTITVTMICKKAGINRGTFYLHYIDKYDMIDKLKEERLAALYDIVKNKSNALQYHTIDKVLNYIYTEFDFISAISTSKYIDYKQAIFDFVEAILNTVPNLEEILSHRYPIPFDYAKIVHISSIQSLIISWIEKGGIETPDEMANIIYSICC